MPRARMPAMVNEPHLRLLGKLLSGGGSAISPAGAILVFEPRERGWLSLLPGRSLTAWEPSKAFVDELQGAGIRCTLDPAGNFDSVIVVCTKFKVRNMWNIARGWALLNPGGVLICAIENSCGAPSLTRFLRDTFGDVAVFTGSRSKVLQVTKTDANANAPLADYLKPGEGIAVKNSSLVAYPGIFSATGLDPGSTILLSAIPESLHGRGADLGAGYGYISCGIVEECPGVTAIDLFEIDALAIRAAERNLSSLKSSIPFAFHWHDVLAPIEAPPYDWVVSNPPFHLGKKVETNLGRAFVRRAAELLRPGGECYLVANTTLPYESVFEKYFTRWSAAAVSLSYKVFHAIK